MIPQRLRHLQQRSDLRAPRTSRPATLVRRARDLIEIPTDGRELLHGLLEKRVFRLWDRRSAAQVAPGEIGKVGRRGHPPGPRTLPEQPPVFGLEAHVQARIAVHPMGRRHRGWFIKGRGPEHDVEQLPKQCRFRDPVAFSESSDAGFRLRRHATSDEGELRHA